MIYVRNRQNTLYTLPVLGTVLKPAGEPGCVVNIASELKGKTVAQLALLQADHKFGRIEFFKTPDDVTSTPGLFPSEMVTTLSTEILGLAVKADELQNDLEQARNNLRTLMEGCSGDMELTIIGQALTTDVSAAALNVAPAGTLKRTFVVALRTKISKEIHSWNCSPLVVTPVEAVADAQVAAPVVTPANPMCCDGRVLLTVTFDTDAGATKTYVAGESLTVEVRVAADDKLLGFTVASVTKTFNVVA